jgi:hypothetical protein
MKFRKKPVVVEAEVYKPGMEDGQEYTFWDRFKFRFGIINGMATKPYINTLEGKHYISQGDYIVTGIKGERYPVKPDIFETTYEPVES